MHGRLGGGFALRCGRCACSRAGLRGNLHSSCRCGGGCVLIGAQRESAEGGTRAMVDHRVSTKTTKGSPCTPSKA